MSLMKAHVLNDSRNSFPLLCKWKKYFWLCKISKIFASKFHWATTTRVKPRYFSSWTRSFIQVIHLWFRIFGTITSHHELSNTSETMSLVLWIHTTMLERINFSSQTFEKSFPSLKYSRTKLYLLFITLIYPVQFGCHTNPENPE